MSTSNDNLYRFVKASERLPERGWKGNLRIGQETGFPHYSSGAFELDTIKVDIWSHPYAEKDYLKHIEWLCEVEADQQEAERVVTEILTKSWTAKFVLSKLQEKFHIIPKQ